MSKILISFLGTGDYKFCNYYIEEQKVENVRFIQEAISQIFCRNWERKDKILVYTTKEAFDRNWMDRGPIEGLGKKLKEINLNAEVHQISIPSGSSPGNTPSQINAEIWELFEIVFNSIEENSEVIFDITHAFRYIPMLGIILINYARLLKNLKSVKVYYGAYEVIGNPRDIDGIPILKRDAPIIDLSSLIALQDWANAAFQFINFCDSTAIKKLTDNEIKPFLIQSKGGDSRAVAFRELGKNLDILTSSIRTNRGLEIVSGNLVKKINENLENIRTGFIKPLNPVLNKIRNRMANFHPQENVLNGLAAIQWCIDNNLIQQGITLLDEVLVSAIILQLNEDYSDEEIREIVSKCVNIKTKGIKEEEWKEEVLKRKDLADRVLSLPLFDKLSDTFQSIKDFRNDINHAGFRRKVKPREPEKFKTKLIEVYNEVKNYFSEINNK
jgi:CRISPR-associated Csx2 family protein